MATYQVQFHLEPRQLKTIQLSLPKIGEDHHFFRRRVPFRGKLAIIRIEGEGNWPMFYLQDGQR